MEFVIYINNLIDKLSFNAVQRNMGTSSEIQFLMSFFSKKTSSNKGNFNNILFYSSTRVSSSNSLLIVQQSLLRRSFSSRQLQVLMKVFSMIRISTSCGNVEVCIYMDIIISLIKVNMFKDESTWWYIFDNQICCDDLQQQYIQWILFSFLFFS